MLEGIQLGLRQLRADQSRERRVDMTCAKSLLLCGEDQSGRGQYQ